MRIFEWVVPSGRYVVSAPETLALGALKLKGRVLSDHLALAGVGVCRAPASYYTILLSRQAILKTNWRT